MDRDRRTMAEIVAEVREQPPSPVIDSFDGIEGPDGRRYTRVADASPAVAEQLLRAGAQVAWDACGCDGYCGYDWLDDDGRRALLRAGRPKIGGRPSKGQWGSLAHWQADDGTDLLLAVNHVHWGDELA